MYHHILKEMKCLLPIYFEYPAQCEVLNEWLLGLIYWLINNGSIEGWVDGCVKGW